MNPILTNIHNDITYLSFLDYVDIKSLCNCSKQLSNICKNNKVLRSILYNKNKNIIITPNFDISAVLKDIYNSIQVIVDINYPEDKLPRWVNKELFNDDMLRKLMDNFLELFVNEIINYYQHRKEYKEITEIVLYDYLVSPALFSNETTANFEDYDIPTTIEIPNSFWNYVVPTIDNIYSQHHDLKDDILLFDALLFDALSDLLFR